MSVAQIGLLLLVACVVAMASRRLRLPYSVGLVAAGIGLALLGGPFAFAIGPNAIYTLLLPPLIFEAALQLRWRPFRHELPVTLALAGPGVVWTAALITLGMHTLAGWSWMGAALFGTLIAATDPVSVIAAFKEMRVERRLSLLVESESLLNDGSAAVLFALLVSVAAGGDVHPGAAGLTLARMAAGGMLIGVAVGAGALLLANRTSDHLVEITLTTIAGYGSFLVAEHFGASGVLASLAAGMLVGNWGWTGPISETARDHVVAFWEYAAFLANSFVFILIGGYEAHQGSALLTIEAVGAIALVLAARILTVYPVCALFHRSSRRIDWPYQHVLVWGGLRGALALALALAIPDSVAEKRSIVVATFAVVAFSIFAQGLTMPLLIRRLGLAEPASRDQG